MNPAANKPKVSVVVPVYNVEKYLRECVDSILAQTLRDIEVILVDDGSPDNCPRIVDEYAARDSRVAAVHQPNGGYGTAVNRGIAMAAGEYIGIIESDDWIEPGMYERLYNTAVRDNSDVVKCSFWRYDSSGHQAEQDVPWEEHETDWVDVPDTPFTVADFPKIVMSHSSIWAALYRAEFIKSIKVIETGKASYQDFPFMCEVMSAARRISVVKECFIHWRNEPESGNSTSQKGARLLYMPKMAKAGIDILAKNNVLDLCREEIYRHIWRTNAGFFERITREYKRDYFDELRRLFEPLAADESFTFRYFPRHAKMAVKAIIAGNYKRTMSLLGGGTLSRLRRVLFSAALPSKPVCTDNFRLTLLGLQFARRDDMDYTVPCWKRVEIKESKAAERMMIFAIRVLLPVKNVYRRIKRTIKSRKTA